MMSMVECLVLEDLKPKVAKVAAAVAVAVAAKKSSPLLSPLYSLNPTTGELPILFPQ